MLQKMFCWLKNYCPTLAHSFNFSRHQKKITLFARKKGKKKKKKFIVQNKVFIQKKKRSFIALKKAQKKKFLLFFFFCLSNPKYCRKVQFCEPEWTRKKEKKKPVLRQIEKFVFWRVVFWSIVENKIGCHIVEFFFWWQLFFPITSKVFIRVFLCVSSTVVCLKVAAWWTFRQHNKSPGYMFRWQLY